MSKKDHLARIEREQSSLREAVKLLADTVGALIHAVDELERAVQEQDKALNLALRAILNTEPPLPTSHPPQTHQQPNSGQEP